MSDPRRPSDPPPQYTRYRARPRLLGGGKDGAIGPAGRPGPRGARAAGDDAGRTVHGGRRRLSKGRVAKWLALAVLGWLALSGVVFLVSAQIQSLRFDDATDEALDPGGYPLTSPSTILVLGSDQRSDATKEPGASTSGPSRADSILLLRVGGGHNARLSIARDTMVDIPGRGRNKVNAAYAFGGSALTVTTLKQYLGIDINHVIEVSFDDFPGLIDAMGGVTVRTGCVVSRINGGFRNGGYTLRLKGGRQRIDGRQALALARTRKNECARDENDLTRAKRQQQIVAAMRSKLTRPLGLFGVPYGSFYRLPLVAWEAPQTLRSDMAGPTLLGVYGALAVGGTPRTRVLGTVSGQVPDAQRQAAVRRFLAD